MQIQEKNNIKYAKIHSNCTICSVSLEITSQPQIQTETLDIVEHSSKSHILNLNL